MTRPLLLTIQEACRELGGVSRAQLYRYIHAGEIEAVHLGRLLKIKSESVEAFVERQSRIEELQRNLERDRISA